MTRVKIESRYVNDTVEAAVVEGLPYPAMLGCSVILLTENRLEKKGSVTDEEWTPPFHCVRDLDSGKEDEGQCAAVTRATANPRKEQPLEAPVLDTQVQPEEMKELQEGDESLKKLRELASSEATQRKGAVRYFLREGLLMREVTRRGETTSQLAIPQVKREMVMKLGHEGLTGGHSGMSKTLQRVEREFFWPGMQGDIRRFVRSCDKCQRLGPRGVVSKESLAMAQDKQAKHFNRRAKPRQFSQGEEVLLLLPEQHNKLQLAWKGPFTVMEKKGGNNYAIQTRPGRTKVYHANLPRRYVRRRVDANAVVTSIVHEDKKAEEGEGRPGHLHGDEEKAAVSLRKGPRGQLHGRLAHSNRGM